MTPELAILISKQKALRAGFEKFYFEFKDYVLAPNQELKVKGENTTYFVMDTTDSEIVISSKNGDYNIGSTKINKINHEHTGIIKIHNTANLHKRVQFLVVVYQKQDKLSKP